LVSSHLLTMLIFSLSTSRRPLSIPCSFFSILTPTPEIYTLSLHDALPISVWTRRAVDLLQECHAVVSGTGSVPKNLLQRSAEITDRKSTRLNSSHQIISYAVFCLKKKKQSARDICGLEKDDERVIDSETEV